MSVAPDAGCGGFACVVGKILRRAAERALDAVCQVFVAAVEDHGKEFPQQPDEFSRHVRPCQARFKVFIRDPR
ncbi:hypothetical protein GCM10007937_21530 [Mesorhizobium albiziae]|nr:hypothetical protein GCM10007937_21530 [Mesorhizobium albiziae]